MLDRKDRPDDYRADDHLEYTYGWCDWVVDLEGLLADRVPLEHIHGSHRPAWQA